MSKTSRYSCILVGGQSLLVQCAEHLLANQYQILAIVSDEPEIEDWGKRNNVEVYPHHSENLHKLAAKDFNYLFSIANLKILPDYFIERATQLAVNFHNGPLPNYAGLNTPSWALINRESKHAINWHVMTAEVDRGDILQAAVIPIDEAETALSLNIKCFEAGYEAFTKLVQQFEQQSVKPVKQEVAGFRYFARCERPDSAATIDWKCPAETIDALLRGLRFGQYRNPLSLPKLYLGSALLVVSEIEITSKKSDCPPGMIVEIGTNVVIATGTHDVLISEVSTVEGKRIPAGEAISVVGFSGGDELPELSPGEKNQISKIDRRNCRSEEFWIKQILAAEPFRIPYAQGLKNGEGPNEIGRRHFEIPKVAIPPEERMNYGDILFAILLLYFARLSQKDYLSVAVSDKRLPDELQKLYFQERVPLNLKLSGKHGFKEYLSFIDKLLESHADKGSYARDLVLREPRLRDHILEDLPLIVRRVSESGDGLIEGAFELAIEIPESGTYCHWIYDRRFYSDEAIELMHQQLESLINSINSSPEKCLSEFSIITDDEFRKLSCWNETKSVFDGERCIHQLFEEQVSIRPDQTALIFRDKALTYAELNNRANQIANLLLARGIKPDQVVGILIDRSPEMVIAMLGVLKAGAAYLPLDPDYPQDRLEFIAQDSGLSALLTQEIYASRFPLIEEKILLDKHPSIMTNQSSQNPESEVTGKNLAYVIYTSGSTGKPKGVMVQHDNVINFFGGMDQRIGASSPGTWLAVTSISFDISVLEILWTLVRGYRVVLYFSAQENKTIRLHSKYPQQDMQYSLFYWNVANDERDYNEDKYRLLMESAKYGDQHGFTAIWTPERHFHAFGGLFPNPSVTSAALATMTENIQLRAGSCVLPLHHPIRVVEEWSMVDNFSNGRVGLAMAAGWQPNDFVLMPQNHADAKNVMVEAIEQVKRLWRGEELEFPGPKGEPVKVRTLPRPIQEELPIWITVAGNPETFRIAGEIGANVLTHLLGQTVDKVGENLKIYREAYNAAGHQGRGHVTLLLHTLVGTETMRVKEIAREPMKNYLKSAMFLVKAAAWQFPAFKTLSEETGQSLDEYFANISDEDMDALLEFAFERYFSTSGLFGTPGDCIRIVDQIKEIGVDEIGCLIDYGIDTDTVLQHLPYLNRLRQISGRREHREVTEDLSIPELIEKHSVTHFQCTPSMASMLLTEPGAAFALKSLDCMMVGGEALSPALAHDLSKVLDGKLMNMYGPTETTIWSTTQEIVAGEELSIGSPISNTYIYVLDKNLQPVPVGVTGELYIGGAGVTRGYLHRPGLTSERFIKNPFVNEEDERIYRTGDLVYFRSDGTLSYSGRTDSQVKIRGHRIEIGEIETLLSDHSAIREAVVAMREDSPGDQRLVAYLVSHTGANVSADELKAMLCGSLPDYMIPANYVFMEEFPLTPNRKIDRNALPAPVKGSEVAAGKSEEPRNAVQQVVTSLWQKVLGLNHVGIHDDFFESGGHSLLATQLIAQLRKLFKVDLPLHTIFDSPTIAAMSQQIISREKTPGQVEQIAEASKQSQVYDEVRKGEGKGAGNKRNEVVVDKNLAITPDPKSDAPVLSFGQERLWFLDKLEPGSQYNDAFALHIQGRLDSKALEKSVNRIVSRHEILRTVYRSHDGSAYQLILPDLTLKLNIQDLREGGEAETLEQRIVQDIARPIDLAEGPVLRTSLFRLGEEEYVFLLVIHQICNDSWSLGVFVDELWKIYAAYSLGNEPDLSELSIQYSDYAQWQREKLGSEVIDEELNYWKEKLAGELPVVDLHADYPRPAFQSFEGSREFFEIPNELVIRLKKFSAESVCTPFITLLTVFKILISRYSGQTDVIVGTPIANREQEETAPLIGMFINNLVLRTDVSGNPTFGELLQRTLKTTLGAFDHANVPFERLVEELHPERDLSRTPLFQIMFDYHNTPMQLPKMADLDVGLYDIDSKMSRFDLTLELAEVSGRIRGYLEYNTRLFASARVQRMAKHFLNLLKSALSRPDQPISDLDMLSATEMQQLIYDWNNTQVDYPCDAGIDELFEYQADTKPDGVAVVFADQAIDYDALNRRVNQVANTLRAKGVNGNEFVGICMERSIDMVVAMLGVLRAGAAYLPLDPGYPAERIEYMVTDSQARVVITDSTFADALGSQTVTTMTLAETSSATELGPRVNHGPEDLAYIIYTSGSTGKPKGVEVTHRTAVNFLCSMQREPGITDTDILLAVTTICFDISVLEIFLPLVSGATVVIASGDDVVDGSSLVSRIEENDVSVMQATPATWRLMLAADWAGSSNLKALCGGEAMPAELIQELYPRAGGGLWNMYGPTETTVWSSTYKLQSAEERPLIGRPIANTRMYVLDSGMQPMPVGVPGELYIAGEGVVRGYHNRPDLTAERFFVDPFVEGGRMYRTGDVARYCADGNIEYLHRIDNQVKIRGFRIELGEIETVLVGHEVIRQGVVTVHNEHGGDARLVAYVVHEEGKHTTASELRKFLRARLPDYMVPTMYVDVPAIPLTPSGKLDRKSLPDPFRRGTAKAGEYTPARTDMEKRIATIWQEALNVESVGIHDNFFDLGGHSLLSMRVIARIERETGCRIGPRAMVMDSLEQIALACPEAARVDAEDQRATPPPASKTLFEKIRQSLGL